MNTQAFYTEETIDIEDAIAAFDRDQIEKSLPQVGGEEDLAKLLINDQEGINIHLIDAQMNHQIDPSYQ